MLGKTERYVCKYSDALIVPSDATKNAIIKRDWTKPNKIFVVNEGVGSNFYRRGKDEIAAVREKYKLGNSRYLIFTGTIQPRKNLPETIHAFSLALKKLENKDLNLVICGKLGWDYEESLNASKKYGVGESVHYLGRVPDEDLPALISGATASVNFSLEEGFGLTLLESMACETPCLLSDIPPFREICGDYALYANPKNLEDMADAIVTTCNFDGSEITGKAKERSLKYSWNETAKKTLSVFQNTVKNF
jgi:glycosyltransferase involved in cell wall biosynthesis